MNINYTENLRHATYLLWFAMALLCALMALLRRDRWLAAVTFGFALATIGALVGWVVGLVAGAVGMTAGLAYVAARA